MVAGAEFPALSYEVIGLRINGSATASFSNPSQRISTAHSPSRLRTTLG